MKEITKIEKTVKNEVHRTLEQQLTQIQILPIYKVYLIGKVIIFHKEKQRGIQYSDKQTIII